MSALGVSRERPSLRTRAHARGRRARRRSRAAESTSLPSGRQSDVQPTNRLTGRPDSRYHGSPFITVSIANLGRHFPDASRCRHSRQCGSSLSSAECLGCGNTNRRRASRQIHRHCGPLAAASFDRPVGTFCWCSRTRVVHLCGRASVNWRGSSVNARTRPTQTCFSIRRAALTRIGVRPTH